MNGGSLVVSIATIFTERSVSPYGLSSGCNTRGNITPGLTSCKKLMLVEGTSSLRVSEYIIHSSNKIATFNLALRTTGTLRTIIIVTAAPSVRLSWGRRRTRYVSTQRTLAHRVHSPKHINVIRSIVAGTPETATETDGLLRCPVGPSHAVRSQGYGPSVPLPLVGNRRYVRQLPYNRQSFIVFEHTALFVMGASGPGAGAGGPTRSKQAR